MEFEWDEKKNLSNVQKHAINFQRAIEVFDGPIVEMEDVRRDYGEKRFIVLGVIKGRILFLVITKQAGKTRIISARKANKNERNRYYRNLHTGTGEGRSDSR